MEQTPLFNLTAFNLSSCSNLSSAPELTLKTDVASIYYTDVLGCDLNFLRQGFRVIIQPRFLDIHDVDPIFYICSLSVEGINLLDQLWHVANSSNASLALEDQRCPVLHVGQYSTLSLPLHQVFGHR